MIDHIYSKMKLTPKELTNEYVEITKIDHKTKSITCTWIDKALSNLKLNEGFNKPDKIVSVSEYKALRKRMNMARYTEKYKRRSKK